MSKTKRLGKGLGELLGREVMEEKNMKLLELPLRKRRKKEPQP